MKANDPAGYQPAGSVLSASKGEKRVSETRQYIRQRAPRPSGAAGIPGHIEAASLCLTTAEHLLSGWEVRFCESIASWRGELTAKQARMLFRICLKCGVPW